MGMLSAHFYTFFFGLNKGHKVIFRAPTQPFLTYTPVLLYCQG